MGKKITVLFVLFFSVAGIYSEDRKSDQEILIEYAQKFLGTPYKAGGTTKDGMDCSGFLFTVVRDSLHISFPRTAKDMFNHCVQIKEGTLNRGDLVFFRTTGGKRISHVGIYLGDGNFIHAASDGPKTGVVISALSESYWLRTYAGAGRFLAQGEVEFELSSIL
ncbi:MAG: C40 family peptidase [Termitinemataceae bacterium]|nr:MAG: C40 family peptidase [Termitinemataceae bacterium]